MTSAGYAKIQVPYDSNGNLLHYAGSLRDVTWVPNEPFAKVLELESVQSGRSAKYLIWQAVDDGTRYPMFVTDLVDLLKSHIGVRDGLVYANWVVQKRGQNYGIRMVWHKDSSPSRTIRDIILHEENVG